MGDSEQTTRSDGSDGSDRSPNTPVRVACWLALAVVGVAATVALSAWLGRPHPTAILSSSVGQAGVGRDLDIGRVRNTMQSLTAMGSRVTGYGHDGQAAELILDELARMGIRDVQVQEFPVAVPVAESAELAAGSVRVPLHPLWPNLARTSQTAPEGLSGPLVYVHDGSDKQLAGKKIQGSILVVDWDCDMEWMAAGEFGAKAVIFRATDRGSGYTARDKILTVPADIPRFYVQEKDLPALDRLLPGGTGILLAAASVPPVSSPSTENKSTGETPMRPTGETPVPQGTIRCKMAWRQVVGKNILAKVCDPADGGAASPAASAIDRQPVVFHAYYDSISVVPGLAPGAEQACGAAVCLELARFLATSPDKPRRPVYVLLTGGHGQALSGMIHFTSELRRGLKAGWRGEQAGSVLARMGRPGLFVGLDLSSRSERIGVFCVGKFRGQEEGRNRDKYRDLGLNLDQFARQHSGDAVAAGEVGSFIDCINLTMGRGWWTYFPYPPAFESELPAIAGIPAITLATVNDDRRYVDTPHDTMDRVRMDTLGRQILWEPGRRVGLANLAVALASWQGPFVSTPLNDVWATAGGRVVWLDQQRDYTPNAPLAKAVVFLKTGRGDKFLMGTRGLDVALSDADGKFLFDGLLQAPENVQFEKCLAEAYGVAEEGFLAANPRAVAEYLKVLGQGAAATSPPAPQDAGKTRLPAASGQVPAPQASNIVRDGSILFAEDMARPKEYPWKVPILKVEQNVNLVCFPCRAITLFGLTDPREYIELSDVQILDVATQGPPFQYGRSATDLAAGREVENCATLWADPTIRVRLTFGFGFQTRRLILINNDPNNPVGEGFALKDLATIPSMVLRGAQDMWTLDQWRIDKLAANGVRNPRVRQIHGESKGYLDRARRATSELDYQAYRSASRSGWALESKVYGELRDMTNNMIRGVLFYLALLIPFAYCLERLLLAGGTVRRRIVGMSAIFLAGFVVLAIAHPAFRFTMTPLIVLLAFVILALGTTVIALLVGRFDRMLREQKQTLAGVHEDIRNVGQIAVHAVDLGIANIRRRPRRGLLTAMTIVLVTFTLLSFTSLEPELNVSRLTHSEGEAGTYCGLMARSRVWAAMPTGLYDSLRRLYGGAEGGGAVVSGRGWFYSDLSGKLSQIDLETPAREASAASAPASGASTTLPSATRLAAGLAPRSAGLQAAGGHFTAVALLCMEPAEPAVTGIDKALLPGGRWFKDDDEVAIILPAHVAKFLGLGPADIGKNVLLFGKELPLIGLIDSAKLDKVRDIDGEPITPVNFVLQEQMQAKAADSEKQADTLAEYTHYPSHEVGIIPLKYGRQLGATLRSVAVKMGGEMKPDVEADRFARRCNAAILASDGKTVTLHASMESSRFSAAGQIVVPAVLGFIMVLGTMLGSVYERRREIFVYNSVGLSPINVSSLFLAESGVYAILGACVGYLLGQGISKVLLVTGLLSGLNLNYSAGATVFVTALTMVIVLLSTLYPARQAFLAAVPETHRHGPEDGESGDTSGDRVDMFMPFVVTAAHAPGMQAYMYEFLDSVQGVTVGQLAVDNLRARMDRRDGQLVPVLAFRAWLAPFDLGVSHDVELSVVFRADHGVHQYHLLAVRFSGDQQNWRRLTPRFLLTVRKQLLIWRILTGEAIQDYVRRGEALFGAPAASGLELAAGAKTHATDGTPRGVETGGDAT